MLEKKSISLRTGRVFAVIYSVSYYQTPLNDELRQVVLAKLSTFILQL
jgi:hypothetical protein